MELYQALITLDGWTFLAQICNLMIQLVIFKKFLLKPIKQVIADRKAKADSEIADAVYNGAATMAHLEDTLLVGTCCGKCRDKASECLERYSPARPRLSLAMSA